MKEQEHGKKRAWVKPELRILARGKQQEAVLVACKNNEAYIGGPGNSHCHATGSTNHAGCSTTMDS
ncbi:MAG: hypothetical protein K9K82_08420 [Desulfobacteraceae bacterium]|nr:hypothetical protein [Desulfobacteraceae bacterium]